MNPWKPIYTAPRDGRLVAIGLAKDPESPTHWVWQQAATWRGRGWNRRAGYRGKPTHWMEVEQ